ncbi:MAG: hypothetical protein HZB29_01400 [Nitrospinae bacterium]|nr:hypothetical protein [Nitrospinota bacterium]
MKAIHLLYDDLPDILPTPEEMRHKRVEVILKELEGSKHVGGLKDWISSMPYVGEDSIFLRPKDAGREDISWDS